MKQLFRNGEQITISPNVATAVNYSNSTSRLKATTVQEAVDEINFNLEEITGGEDIDMTIHEKLDQIMKLNTVRVYKYVTEKTTVTFPEKTGNLICDLDLKDVNTVLLFINYNNAANGSAIKVYFDDTDMGKLGLSTNYIWMQQQYDVSSYESMKSNLTP